MGVDRFLGKLRDIFLIWFVLLNNNLPLGLKLRKSDCEANLVFSRNTKVTVKGFG